MSNATTLDNYEHFVGTFITQFATLESFLRRLLFVQSGMDDIRFDIFVGYPKTHDLIEKIQTITKAFPLEEKSQISVEVALCQLKNLLKIRNRIAHFGGNRLDNGMFLIRTHQFKESQDTGQPYDLFTSHELWMAAKDLSFITSVLNYHLDPVINQQINEIGDEHSLMLNEHLTIEKDYTWTYIPPEQRPKKK